MQIARSLFGTIPMIFAGLCVGTTVAQTVGLAVVWQSGAMSQDKVVRYTAVLYGLDLSRVPSGQPAAQESSDQLKTREQVLEERVAESDLLEKRRSAVDRGAESMRLLFGDVRVDNERFEQLKAGFDEYLDDLEQQARKAAIKEVERILSVLPQKQSKDLLLRMLADQGQDATDDIMADVVTILKSMPRDKRKKVCVHEG